MTTTSLAGTMGIADGTVFDGDCVLSAIEITLTSSSSVVVDDACMLTFSLTLWPERSRAKPSLGNTMESCFRSAAEEDVGDCTAFSTSCSRKAPGGLSLREGGTGVFSSLDCGPGRGTPC